MSGDKVYVRVIFVFCTGGIVKYDIRPFFDVSLKIRIFNVPASLTTENTRSGERCFSGVCAMRR